MMPRSRCSADVPPERCCEIMAEELAALAQDIAAARRRAHRTATPALGLGRRSRPPDGEPVRLDRGARITIRPVRPDDAGRLRAAYGRLSALTRYHRFLTTDDRLTSHQLAYLTQVDHVAHEALVALDASTGAIVGVARYVRDPVDPRPRAGRRGRHRLLATTRRRDRAARAAPRAGPRQRRRRIHRCHRSDQRRRTAADAPSDVDRGRRTPRDRGTHDIARGPGAAAGPARTGPAVGAARAGVRRTLSGNTNGTRTTGARSSSSSSTAIGSGAATPT